MSMDIFNRIHPASSWDYMGRKDRRCFVCKYPLHPGRYGMEPDGVIAYTKGDPKSPKWMYNRNPVLVCDKECADKISC